jgi:integrase/recombinase XerD
MRWCGDRLEGHSFLQVARSRQGGSMESFEKQFADTLAIRGLSPRTQVVYVPMLREFARFVGKPLDTVVPEDLRTYQRHLAVERQVGFSHFNQATCALRLFFRECLGKTDWPFERIPFQRKRRILPEILSQEEVARIFDACSNLKHKTVLMTAYSGGLRLGETLALLPSDIDSGRMVIRVEQGKGRKDRYVMLSKTLLQTLREYWRAFRPLRWLFYGQTKQKPLAPSTAEKIFKIAARKATITKNVSFHSLRHAFATHLLEDGTNVRVIQALLGHRSLTTTQIYTHVARTYVNDTRSPLDRIEKKDPTGE